MAHPAMHHAMAECREPPPTQPLSRPRHYRGQYLARRREWRRAEIWGCYRLAVRPGRVRRRTRPEAIYLAGKKPLCTLVEAEFERRRAGVDHADQRFVSRRCHFMNPLILDQPAGQLGHLKLPWRFEAHRFSSISQPRDRWKYNTGRQWQHALQRGHRL